MIDLHLHLDGSITAGDIIKIAEKSSVLLPTNDEDELNGLISVDMGCKSLNDYLKCFDIPLLIMQKEENIKNVVYLLVKRLYKSGLVYAEIRFAPQLSTREGLSQEKVTQAAVSGLARAVDEIKAAGGFFMAQLILCCMRGDKNQRENAETIAVCSEFLGNGVAAADLAGAEGLFKTESFSELFKEAYRRNIPFTVHAGEADGADSIRAALSFGASRIGHGVRAAEDAKLLQYLIDNKIPLEMCPVSNVQTKAVKSIKAHPIKKFLDMGARVCVNTDNMVVSRTDIFNEFEIIQKELGVTDKDRKKLIENSISSAFLSKEDKEILRSRVGKLIEACTPTDYSNKHPSLRGRGHIESVMCRKSTAKDCSDIYDLICELENKKLNYNYFKKIYTAQTQDNRYCCLVCENEGKVIGMLNLRFEEQLHHTEKIAEILEFCVSEKYRSRGIGQKLFECCCLIAKANGCSQIEVDSSQVRINAHRFYLKQKMSNTHYKFSKRL